MSLLYRLFLLCASMLWISEIYAQDSIKQSPKFHDAFISGFFNHLNDGYNYGMGIAGAYYKNVYAEARWNYEDLNTFTILGGYSFSNDEHAVEWELVPMAGFAMGNFNAFIPAFEMNFTYKKLNLYSESEYAISFDSKSEDYFFMWNEMTYAIKPWFQPGIVVQRTRLFKSQREIDRGFMLNAEILSKFTLTGYLFDPFDKDRIFYVIALNYDF
jgi:hypothetical protein